MVTPVPGATRKLDLQRLRAGVLQAPQADVVAVEEPLEIRVAGRSVAVLLRTPGDDDALAVGFLLTERILAHASQVDRVQPCAAAPAQAAGNIVDVILEPGATPDFSRHATARYSNSACGVCGAAALENLPAGHAPLVGGVTVASSTLLQLPDALRAQQHSFNVTGGLHGAAVLGPGLELLCVKEDVGRHNACDKTLGAFAMHHPGTPPRLLVVTSRAGFEIVEKAHACGVHVVLCVGAPTSLAVAAADRAGITLCAFAGGQGCNVYSHAHRVREG